jgi:hypothetical protein
VRDPDCLGTETEVLWWPALFGLLVLLLPLVVVLAKRLRRRRRRRGDATRRVVGAWREVRDRLASHGLPASAALTPHEVADSCRGAVGDEPAGRIAEMGPVMDWALFRQEAPADDLGDRAWDVEAGVADALKRQTGLGRRVRAALDPRPLLHR